MRILASNTSLFSNVLISEQRYTQSHGKSCLAQELHYVCIKWGQKGFIALVNHLLSLHFQLTLEGNIDS